MKKQLLLMAVAMMATTAGFAQKVQTVDARESMKTMAASARQMTFTKAPERATLSTFAAAPRKAYADSVLMMRSEGLFYNSGQLTSGTEFSSVLVPPFTDFKFINLCADTVNYAWMIQDEQLEANEDRDLDYLIPKGRSINSLYYAPSIQVGEISYSLVDFIQPVDSGLYAFNYLNTTKSGYWYSSNGSPFMTEDIPWDFDEDGVKENNNVGGIRQYYAEKPVQPLILNEIYFPFYSTKEAPLAEGQALTAIVRKLEVDDKRNLVMTDTIAVMDVTADDLESYGAINGTQFNRFGASFALYEEDEFGTLTAQPIVLDDMFAIDIRGFNNEETDIETFWCDQSGDEAEFWSGNARPTLIICDGPDGNEAGALRYYGRGEDPYCYNAIFFLYGEMDAMMIDSGAEMTVDMAGGDSQDEEGYPAYVYSTYPIFEEVDGDWEWSYNYDFEGIPDWADLKINPTYYENETYPNVRGLNLIWVEVGALPADQSGREAFITMISDRGAKMKDDEVFHIVQGDPSQVIPDGVKTVVFDRNGKFVKGYNLGGQNIDNALKGILIKDGKKILVK